ncbi:MAG: diaminopimelate epimerase [Rickettsiales bacterium]
MQNSINFYKMEGLGNDFIIIDANNQKNNYFNQKDNFFLLEEEFIKKISNRNTGIGCDQIAIFSLHNYIQNAKDNNEIDQIDQEDNQYNNQIDQINQQDNTHNNEIGQIHTQDIKYSNQINEINQTYETNIKNKPKLYLSIYNQDGSEVSMCVNIIRCIATLIFKLYNIKELDILIFNKLVTTSIEADNLANINIGKANIINNINELELKNIVQKSGIEIDYFKCINVGNNHLILIVNDAVNENLLDKFNFDIEKFGKYLSQHDIFKQLGGVNVNFVKILNRNKVAILVYELGVGLTFACGSGAAASFYATSQFGFTEKEIIAQFKYGNLHLSLNKNEEINIKGECNLVFNGTYYF